MKRSAATVSLKNQASDVTTEILCGVHTIEEVIRARRRQIYAVYRSDTGAHTRHAGLLEAVEVLQLPTQTLSAAQMATLAGTPHHQGWALRVSPFPLATDLPRLWEQVQAKPARGFWLILDQVVDPHNLGALLRTAHIVGANGVILSKDRSAPASPTVSRISAGAMEHIHLVQVTNLVRSMQWLQQQGLWLTGLAREATAAIYSADFTAPAGLLIGGEARGLRRLVRQHCDQLVSIPQQATFNSLNASVAGAVAMYEVFRQRYQGRDS